MESLFGSEVEINNIAGKVQPVEDENKELHIWKDTPTTSAMKTCVHDIQLPPFLEVPVRKENQSTQGENGNISEN